MLSSELLVKFRELVVALIQLPLSVPRADVDDIKDYVLVVDVPSFIFRELDLQPTINLQVDHVLSAL